MRVLNVVYHQSSGLLKRQIRDNDNLSEIQINMILGNEIATPSLQQQKPEKVQKQMFYNLLPLKNQVFPRVRDPQEIIIQDTPNQNIFLALGLHKQSSYMDYCSALSNYRSEIDLYGQQTAPTRIVAENLQFYHLLKHDSKYLESARKMHMINISLPGTIQCQDSRNFLQLRPIQQFRHTPIIPIAESTMRKHKEMLQAYHRRQFVLQISKQSIVHWVMMLSAFSVCGYLLYMVWQKEEERSVSYSKLQYQRLMGEKSAVDFRLG